MQRLSYLVALFALAGMLAFGLAHRGTSAQDATPEHAGPGLVGTWQWGAATGISEPVSFAIFHADGTYVGWNQVAGAAIGLWRMTGARTFDLLWVYSDADPSPTAWAPGTATFVLKGELDDTGNAIFLRGTIDVRDAGGMHLATVPWSAPATRMTFDRNPATSSVPATPAAATPAP
jgi:hypothetical protein